MAASFIFLLTRISKSSSIEFMLVLSILILIETFNLFSISFSIVESIFSKSASGSPGRPFLRLWTFGGPSRVICTVFIFNSLSFKILSSSNRYPLVTIPAAYLQLFSSAILIILSDKEQIVSHANKGSPPYQITLIFFTSLADWEIYCIKASCVSRDISDTIFLSW